MLSRFALVLFWVAGVVGSQESVPTFEGPPGNGGFTESSVDHDSSAIAWVLPGAFADAQARAKSEQRMLLVMGVSFGIDVAGAKCATEGTW